MNKYVEEITSYSISIGDGELSRYESLLLDNHPITPEVVGMLIGRAKPVLTPIKCRLCEKRIKIGKEYRTEKNKVYISFEPRYERCHQVCVERYLKSNGISR